MRVDRHIAVSAGWVAGPAFGVAMMAAPEYLHLSHTVAAVAFWGGLVVFALTLVIVFVLSAEDRRPRGRALGPLILMAVGLAIFGAGAGWYLWPHGGNVAKRTASQPPEKIQDETTINEWSPQIKLIGPKNPALVLINDSGKLLTHIKWSAAIWNLDDLRTYTNQNPAPGVYDPLPIPVSTFDFLRPHTSGGPQKLIDDRYVKKGNRLVGSVSAICPECSRGHTYVLNIVWGEGGWFAEVPDMKEGELAIPHQFTSAGIVSYAAAIEKRIPIKERIAIK